MHEQTITFPLRSGPNKGMFVNTPSIYNGKNINEDIAHDLFLQGKLRKIGIFFPTINDAEKAAVTRSYLFNPDDTINTQRFNNLLREDVLRTIHYPRRGR